MKNVDLIFLLILNIENKQSDQLIYHRGVLNFEQFLKTNNGFASINISYCLTQAARDLACELGQLSILVKNHQQTQTIISESNPHNGNKKQQNLNSIENDDCNSLIFSSFAIDPKLARKDRISYKHVKKHCLNKKSFNYLDDLVIYEQEYPLTIIAKIMSEMQILRSLMDINNRVIGLAYSIHNAVKHCVAIIMTDKIKENPDNFMNNQGRRNSQVGLQSKLLNKAEQSNNEIEDQGLEMIAKFMMHNNPLNLKLKSYEILDMIDPAQKSNGYISKAVFIDYILKNKIIHKQYIAEKVAIRLQAQNQPTNISCQKFDQIIRPYLTRECKKPEIELSLSAMKKKIFEKDLSLMTKGKYIEREDFIRTMNQVVIKQENTITKKQVDGKNAQGNLLRSVLINPINASSQSLKKSLITKQSAVVIGEYNDESFHRQPSHVTLQQLVTQKSQEQIAFRSASRPKTAVYKKINTALSSTQNKHAQNFVINPTSQQQELRPLTANNQKTQYSTTRVSNLLIKNNNMFPNNLIFSPKEGKNQDQPASQYNDPSIIFKSKTHVKRPSSSYSTVQKQQNLLQKYVENPINDDTTLVLSNYDVTLDHVYIPQEITIMSNGSPRLQSANRYNHQISLQKQRTFNKSPSKDLRKAKQLLSQQYGFKLDQNFKGPIQGRVLGCELYNGPGHNHDLLGKLEKDGIVQILARTEDQVWVQVKLLQQVGWVLASNVDFLANREIYKPYDINACNQTTPKTIIHPNKELLIRKDPKLSSKIILQLKIDAPLILKSQDKSGIWSNQFYDKNGLSQEKVTQIKSLAISKLMDLKFQASQIDLREKRKQELLIKFMLRFLKWPLMKSFKHWHFQTQIVKQKLLEHKNGGYDNQYNLEQTLIKHTEQQLKAKQSYDKYHRANLIRTQKQQNETSIARCTQYYSQVRVNLNGQSQITSEKQSLNSTYVK
eukprot:403355803